MPSLRRKSRQWLAGGVAAFALSLAVVCAVVGIAPDVQFAENEAAEAAALVVNDRAAAEQPAGKQLEAKRVAGDQSAADQPAARYAKAAKPAAQQAEPNGADAVQGEAVEPEPAIIVNEATGQSYAANRVLVTVDASTDAGELKAMLASQGIDASEIELISDAAEDKIIYLVTYDGIQDPASLDGALDSVDEAIAIEPDYIMTLDSSVSYEKEQVVPATGSKVPALDATVNDPYFSNQWENTAVKGTSAWDIVKGNGNVTVVVIDSGADANHPDLKNNLILGSYAKNTYTETYGASAVNDIVGHGTHVAGIIAAQANNGQGTAGITYNARVLPIKVSFNEKGQMYTSDIVEAIEYVVDLKNDPSSPAYLKNIRVINMSLGGGDRTSSFQTVINTATSAGILVVATAGNNTGYVSEYYPGGYNNVLCVSALAQASGTPGFVFDSSYSNWGPMVDISGPGTSLYAPVPTSSYGYKSGTSMAAPVVSGVAALCYAANMGLSPSQVSSILESTAVDVTKDDDGYSTGSGFDQYTGYGCVQAYAAVSKAKGTTPEPEPAPGSDVYVGGVGLASGQYLAEGASAATTVKPAGGYAHYANGILTLHDYTYSGTGYNYAYDYSAGIYAESSLDIVLEGENSLTLYSSSSDPEGIVLGYGCDLSFEGEGSLVLDAEMYGLYLYEGDLTVDCGALTVDVWGDCVYADGDAYLYGGAIDLTSTENEGLDVGGTAVIAGADVSIAAEYDAIYADYGLTVESGSLVAKSLSIVEDSFYYSIKGAFGYADELEVLASTEPDGELEEYEPSSHDSYDLITVGDPEAPGPEPTPGLDVYVGGVGLADGYYLAEGASSATTVKPSGGYAHYADGALTLHDYSYTGTGYNYAYDYSAGVYADSSLQVVLEGESSLTLHSDDNDPEGIVLDYDCDLTFYGEGSLAIDAEMYGIYMYEGDLCFEGGVLAIEAVEDCIFVDGYAEVNGGVLDLESLSDNAIDVDSGDITINGGDVTAVAEFNAIESQYGLYIYGGTLLAASLNVDEDPIWSAINASFVRGEDLSVMASTEPDGELVEYDESVHFDYDLIVVGDASPEPDPEFDVYVGGVGLASGQYLAEGASSATTVKPSGGYAHYADGILTLHDYSYSGEGYNYGENYWAAVFSYVTLDVVLEGENSLTVSSDAAQPEGIVVVHECDLTVEGGGSLAIDAEMYGIYLYDGNLVVDCGAIEVNSDTDGFFIGGDVVLAGGSVVLDAGEGNALTTPYGDITVDGAEVSATAELDAVSALGDVIVESGALTARSYYEFADDDELYMAVYTVEGSFEVADAMTVMAATKSNGTPSTYVPANHATYDLIIVEPSSEPEPATYTVAVSASPAAGGTVTGAGTYEEGETVTVKATANSGYKFVKWTENGTQVSTSASYTFKVSENRSLTAVFEAVGSEPDPEPSSYAIALTASPAEGGVVVGAGTYTKDSTVTVAAVANSGYQFVKWTENGTQVSTSAAYTFKVSESRSLTAVFEAVGSAPEPEPPYSDLWKSFPDVMKEVERAGGPAKVWYVANGWLDYVVDAGLMSGYASNGWFGPYDNITRGQVAVILFRAECAKDPSLIEQFGSTTDPSKYAQMIAFKDEEPNVYYTAAINWAKYAGIMTGDAGNGYKTVRPNDPVARQELCLMLARYANGGEVPPTQLDPVKAEGIKGMNQIASWARDGVYWAVNNGVIGGVNNGDGTFSMDPTGKTWRSAAAKMFTVVMRDVL